MLVPFFRRAGSIFLDILFPCHCIACGADTTATRVVLCDLCLDALPLHSALFCPRCLGRVPDLRTRCHPDAFLAGAATSYDEPAVKDLVHALKYRGVRSAALPLGTLLARYLEQALPRELLAGAILVPIPLSAARERLRGYNQAEKIARAAGALLPMPLESRLLRRVRHTKPQTELANRAERFENMRGSFAAEGVSGRTVIVVDDVYTSGATMQEAVRALRAAGAKRVIGVAAARA